MDQIRIVGLDLAKRVFQVHGAGANGRVLFRKKLSRGQLLPFFATSGRASLQWRPARRRIIGLARSERSGIT